MDGKTVAATLLILIVLALGGLVSRHSRKRQPIYGGALAVFFNFLSGMLFAAILPSICISVLVLHPALVDIAGITLSPLLLIAGGLMLLSLLFSFLFALVESGPLERARQQQTQREAQGWTEADAKSSGL